ncbi:MAG: hypothetical protein D6730_04025 [Bacteroidetes bacterium]|nr:MAG: hypothetical protein D6730_04025 [Bacteroidota bacterium]
MFEQICQWLDEHEVAYRSVHHEPTPTSEESARARGEDLKTGGKALLLKVGKQFHLFVLSAARKLDAPAVKKKLGAKKLRFASREELHQLTGLQPGAVPPFGKPFFELQLYVDTSIPENEKIAFNAGSLTDSVIMKTTDYLRLANPIIFSFSK